MQLPWISRNTTSLRAGFSRDGWTFNWPQFLCPCHVWSIRKPLQIYLIMCWLESTINVSLRQCLQSCTTSTLMYQSAHIKHNYLCFANTVFQLQNGRFCFKLNWLKIQWQISSCEDCIYLYISMFFFLLKGQRHRYILETAGLTCSNPNL